MSSSPSPKTLSLTHPIPLPTFTAALPSLPLSTLYAKHAELTNATTHLLASNAELERYARENNDVECYEAVLENREVLCRFEERRGAVKREVEGRGVVWRGEGEGGDGEVERVRRDEERGGSGVLGGGSVEGGNREGTNGVARERVNSGETRGDVEGRGEDGVFL